MNRSTLVLAIALAMGSVAYAQDAKPTPAQIEKAKKAFAAGKKAFDGGDFPEAVQKFKESYNLSKNPVLLYNIAFANEQAGMEDIALFYYRKFLTDAPEDAAQRGEVTEKVKVLEKKFQGGGTTTPTTPTTPTVKPAEPSRTEPVVIKPVGTYSANDFQHQVVDAAPPKKPLDVTAFVPEDSGFQVTLYFRTAGEGKFTAKLMKWRYKELVARVPPEKMLGDSMQYYIEVKDQAGTVVTRAGKSTSPNLVTLENGASPRFYPDWSDDGEVETPQERVSDDTEEDPLNGNKKKPTKPDDDDGLVLNPEPTGPGTGFRDVGSSKFTYMKWGSTITAGALLGLSVFSYLQAGSFASALEDDAAMMGESPKMFDDVAQGWESSGKRYQTIHKVTLGIGVGVAVVAGYYWYKDLKAKKSGDLKVSGKASPSPETSWNVVPSLGTSDNSTFVGAAAAGRF